MQPFLKSAQRNPYLLIGAALLLLWLLTMIYSGVREYQRNRREAQLETLNRRVVRQLAMDSLLHARLSPERDSLLRAVKALSDFQRQQSIKNLLQARKNENLNKQMDSINAVVGVRPDF